MNSILKFYTLAALMLITYRSLIVVIKQSHNPRMGIALSYAKLPVGCIPYQLEMVNFKALISVVTAPVQRSRPTDYEYPLF